ncbi:MAG: hypothetical protein ACOX8Q_05555 [Christensenellales bacterium]|jgi:hypothetical protein
MDFNRKETLYRKLGAAVLVIVLTVALLTGCGKSAPAVSDDPNIGLWKATKVEMFGEESDADEVFDGDFELELMAGGKCELRGDDGKDTYTWAVHGNTLTISANGTDFISATIKGGVMVIGDFMETGMKITLEKEGAAANNPVSSDMPADEVGYYVIDSMTIDGEHYDAESVKDMGISYYIRLNEDNTAQISTDALIKGTWKDGKIRYQQDGEGVVNEYVLEGDALTIEISDGDSQATLVFKRSSESGAQAMWDAAWYGYIWVTDGFGSFENDEEFFNDAYLTIEIDETGAGTLEIILDGDDENMVEATIKADEDHFEVTEGFFWDMQLDPSEWWIALSPGSEGKMFVISDTYTDPEGGGKNGFEYMFCFRPYGELWEHEEREGDRVPPGYGMYKDEQSLGGDTADPDTGGGDATGEAEDAAPHFTYAELKGIYNKLSQAYDDFSLKDLKYDEVCDKYFDGIAGILDLEGNTLTIYKWFAVDQEESYVQVSFQDYSGDGNRTAGGIGSYFP